jgi:succinate-acetate transporter protein
VEKAYATFVVYGSLSNMYYSSVSGSCLANALAIFFGAKINLICSLCIQYNGNFFSISKSRGRNVGTLGNFAEGKVIN